MIKKLETTVYTTNKSYRKGKKGRKMELRKLLKNYTRNKIPQLRNMSFHIEKCAKCSA